MAKLRMRMMPMINLIKKKQNIQKIETITQPRALPLVIGDQFSTRSIFHSRKNVKILSGCEGMFDIRFLSCILSWQPKNKFHGLLRFLRFFKICTYNYILQCFNVSLKVPGFYYWVLVCWLDSSLEITFRLWPPCVTSEYSPAVGPAPLSGVLQY